MIGFHAGSIEGLVPAFHEAVDDYLETCAAIGKEPEKAFSGKPMLRVDPVLHRKRALAAELHGKNLKQFGEEALRKAFTRRIRAAHPAFP